VKRAAAIGCLAGVALVLAGWSLAFVLLWGSIRGLRGAW